MTQQEITIWETKNQEDIIGWTINYNEKGDIIVFEFKDKTKKLFTRDKRE